MIYCPISCAEELNDAHKNIFNFNYSDAQQRCKMCLLYVANSTRQVLNLTREYKKYMHNKQIARKSA